MPGSLKPSSAIRVPPRTILWAESPAAVGYCNHLSDQITEAVFKALADVLPNRVAAGWAQRGTTVSGAWQGRTSLLRSFSRARAAVEQPKEWMDMTS